MQRPANILFESIRSAITPGAGEIRALIVPNDDPLVGGFSSFLSKQQRARCRRFDDPRDRRAAMVCKGLWRIGAGMLVGQEPGCIEVQRDRWSRPILKGVERDTLDLNVTRTRTHCALVVARGCRVGIDLESVEPGLITEALIEAVLHDADPLLDHSDGDAFFGLWTMKEAVLKGDGRGLEVDPRRVRAGACGGAADEWVLCGCHDESWYARGIVCPDGVKGAVASNRVPVSYVQVAWESIVATVTERGSCARVASANP